MYKHVRYVKYDLVPATDGLALGVKSVVECAHVVGVDVGQGVKGRVRKRAKVVPVKIGIPVFGNCLLRNQLLGIVWSVEQCHQVLSCGYYST